MPKRSLRIIIYIIILGIIFYFMAKYFYTNWHKVPFNQLRFNYWFLALSYLIWFIGFPFNAYIWKKNIEIIGEKISFIQGLRITALAALPRYIPGRIWGIAGQVYLTKKEGAIPGSKSGVGVILGTAVNTLSGILLFVIIFPLTQHSYLTKTYYLMFLLIPLLLIMLYPPLFIKIVNFGLKILKRDKITFIPKYSQIIFLLILYTLLWISQCVGIYFLIKSFYQIRLSFLLPLCAIYPAAWVIGFLSLISPGGVGIREGVLSYLFNFYMPTSIGIITSILIRIWGTIGEIITFLIFAKSLRKYI
ncbi:MAG: lysylphosphatidylglycerol synthase domain-containing protein [candidate division WOR-3 bacterium]